MGEGRTRADTRMTLRQAAAVLGVSESAIRKRVERGTLRSDKGPGGRRYVYLDAGADAMADKGADTSAMGERDALISELRARIEDLRTDRDAWRDQARRSDYMASAAMDRTRELEGRLRELEPAKPSQGPTESSETPEEEPEGADPRPATTGPQTNPQPPQGITLRGLRRRILGW